MFTWNALVPTRADLGGGETAMFHSGYGSLGPKGWGRWKYYFPRGYLRYDMRKMRGVGRYMAGSTGLFEFTKLKPSQTKMQPSVIGGER